MILWLIKVSREYDDQSKATCIQARPSSQYGLLLARLIFKSLSTAIYTIVFPAAHQPRGLAYRLWIRQRKIHRPRHDRIVSRVFFGLRTTLAFAAMPMRGGCFKSHTIFSLLLQIYSNL